MIELTAREGWALFIGVGLGWAVSGLLWQRAIARIVRMNADTRRMVEDYQADLRKVAAKHVEVEEAQREIERRQHGGTE